MAATRTALVTGSTAGIGKETALGLAQAGLKVFVHGRNKPKVEQALADLTSRAPGVDFEGISFDLGSMASVRKGATELLERLGPDGALDVLVANAGIFASERVVTGDGIEATLAVNHVGHVLLAHLLAPAIKRGAPARVIVVSSIAHTRGRIHLDDLTLERAFSGYAAYAQSKLANVMWGLDLAANHPPADLVAYVVHPGVVSTKLLRDGFGPVRGAAPAVGATMQIKLATAETLPDPSGTYYSEGYVTAPAPAANDIAVRDALRVETERLAGITSS